MYYSKCNVILEQIIDRQGHDFDTLILYARALLREHSVADAIEIYKKALLLNPNFQDEELDRTLRLSGSATSEDGLEDQDEDYFIQRPDINFEDVGVIISEIFVIAVKFRSA